MCGVARVTDETLNVRSPLDTIEPNPAQTLEDVCVNAEGLIFRGGRICPESFALPSYEAQFRRPDAYARFLLKNYWLRRGAVRVPTGIWVTDNVSNNYFHWMIESLPRLLRAEHACPEQDTLLLPRPFSRLPFVAFTLRAFPQIGRVGWIGERSKIRVGRLVNVPRLPRQPPARLPDRNELAEVARRVAGLVGRGAPARRIYFSRSDAQRRRARNEDELVRLLRAHDFEVLHLDQLKPWEQIAWSLAAEISIGLHGAALTNLIFMPEGARLIELRNPDHHWGVYERLAKLFGIEYRSVACETAADGVALGKQHADLIVDLDRLRESLRDVTAT
jgi:capsular polysaccharide biosynthesis protein